MSISPARRAAFKTLLRVFEQEAYTDRAFAAEARRLNDRDRALAQRLAYGTVQRVRTLDHAINELGKKSPGTFDPPVRAALRLGAYQLAFSAGIPAHAAVNESVELVREYGPPYAIKFTNAIMRRLSEGARALIENLPEWTPREAALRYSYPDWIAETFWRELGPDDAPALMRAQNEPAETAVRRNTLKQGELEGDPDPLIPGALVVKRVDGKALADGLAIRTETLPIADVMGAFERALSPVFAGRAPDVTEENIQARIRGNVLMALSNKFDSLLLTTGNKSELAVGYCTIYGDMSGGLAVISDVPKTMVYEVARWLNDDRGAEVIPRAILDKAPSAELRPDQTDQDSLPPYGELDGILELLIEERLGVEEIVAQGYDQPTVERVVRLVGANEFKRKQAAPGIKVTDRAFGIGWRMPIATVPLSRRRPD